jgi:hypothetical protein
LAKISLETPANLLDTVLSRSSSCAVRSARASSEDCFVRDKEEGEEGEEERQGHVWRVQSDGGHAKFIQLTVVWLESLLLDDILCATFWLDQKYILRVNMPAEIDGPSVKSSRL